MEFARALLEKHGWTEGKGLGKQEHGRAEALRPKLKFDTRGIGETGSNNFQWWDHAFNSAAINIEVAADSDDETGGVVIKSKGETRTGLLSTRPPKKAMKTIFYGSFVKASTTLSSVQGESDEPKDMSKKMTDEEIFKACGGLTAHKAARHGNKLSGKLARIEAADRELAARLSSGIDVVKAVKELNDSSSRKRPSDSDDSSEQEPDTSGGGVSEGSPKKRKKHTTSSKGKKKAKKADSGAESDASQEDSAAATGNIKKKSKKSKGLSKKKLKNKDDSSSTADTTSSTKADKKKKDKKKKKKDKKNKN
eukprot:m.68421 g.68421  ORF g.68421 m.68421 type:complete len:308 (-) comp8508_c1_seq1:30-953(-)